LKFLSLFTRHNALSSEAGLLLGESATESLLEFGCCRIAWIESQDGVQFFEAGTKLLQAAGGRVIGGVKLRDGGWNIGLAVLDFGWVIAQEGLRYVLWLEWCLMHGPVFRLKLYQPASLTPSLKSGQFFRGEFNLSAAPLQVGSHPHFEHELWSIGKDRKESVLFAPIMVDKGPEV
jgi:hypothetical protein